MSVHRILVLGLVLALALPAAAEAAKPPERQLYVSLGDSYATGYQVGANGRGANTRNGFAYQVPKLAKPRGYRFKLVNFGCGGETTTSLLERRTACPGPAPGGPDYEGRTQIAAAERFLRAHRGEVGLITVSIGGNDVTSCAREADPVPCVAAAVGELKANVTTLSKRLRKAAGRKPRIVGITYPDVILGQWVGPDPNQDLARLSVVAFKELINPALKAAYATARGKLVDVTRASGAYGSLDELVPLPPYAFVPKPVARVCRLTYYCEFRDIHARTRGYRLIAELIVKSLPKPSDR
jgi:lysophospholipase L1-like esterase